VLALGKEDRRAALLECANDVVQYRRVPRFVVRERRVELLDTDLLSETCSAEGRLADNEPMLERACIGLGLGVDPEAHRTDLHLGDRMMSVAPLRRRRQPDNVPRLYLP